jgi:oligopeptide transport system substrate-binding protein
MNIDCDSDRSGERTRRACRPGRLARANRSAFGGTSNAARETRALPGPTEAGAWDRRALGAQMRGRLLRMRSLACVLISGVAITVLAACGGRETAVERGNREGVLHRGIGADMPVLDPHLANGVSDYTVLSAVLEGLVSEDPVTLAPVPGVAESWTVSDDGLTYTFNLRAGARWTNGDPVTAQDFIRSWRRALAPALAADYAYLLHIVDRAQAFNTGALSDFSQVGLSAPDARTVVIRLAHPAAHFLSMLNNPVWLPVHMDTVGRLGAADSRANPWARPENFVGNGPFKLRELRPGQRVVVERDSGYWDAATVQLREVHFHAIESLDAEERAFRAGQLHVTEALPVAKVRHYRDSQPQLLRIDPYLGTYFYRLNTARPPLDDARVRRALALAVDREAIVERILGGGQLPATSFTPHGAGSYAPPPVVRTDFDEARQLLAEAGFASGAGLPQIEILYNTSENHRIIAEAIQEMWRRELGIDVVLANQDFKVTLDARRTGNYQVLRSVWIADFADASSFLGVFTSASGNNHTRWTDAKFDRLVESATRAAAGPDRDAQFRGAEILLLDAMPVIPIYHYTHVFLIQPSVRGWHPTLLDRHPLKHVRLESPK